MLVSEQAEAQAQRAGQPRRSRSSRATAGIQGVIGIVAGRLKERLGRPAIVIALDEDGTGKGSGRSISGVDLGAAVLAAKDSGLLIAGGGHAMAAGLTLAAGRARAVSRLHQRAARRRRRESARRPRAAARRLARAGRCRRQPLRRARCGGPYGAGWPSPRVAAGPARLIKAGIVGDGHVRGDRLRRRWQELQVDRLPQRRQRPRPGAARRRPDRRWWLAGTIKRDEWNGGNAAEMHLEDAALA